MERKFSEGQVRAAFPEWDVRGELGKGTFKSAFEVQDAEGPRVLKVLHEPLNVDADNFAQDSLPERFQREIAAMAAHECPHVATIIESPLARKIGELTHVYYTEPLYSGGTLDQRIASGAVPLDDAKAVVRQLLVAVQAMDDLGIVHRDIKPANIAFDSEGNAILIDLGIAYVSDLSDLTDSMGQVPRTPRYAAPEQFEMRRYAEIDSRTDLYAVGIVAYEMVVGSHPFFRPGITMGEYFQIMESFGPSSLPDDFPGDLRDLVVRLLKYKKFRRFKSATDALRELDRS